MRRSHLTSVVLLGVAMVLAGAGKLHADFYDSFSDGSYSEPVWHIDNPQWWFYPLFGSGQFAQVQSGAVRIFADANPYLPYYAMAALAVDDLDYDANTSATWWDDSTSHYILAKVYYPGNVYRNPNEPNDDTGSTMFCMHGDPDLWTSLLVNFTLHNCAYQPPNKPYHWELENFWNEHINLQVTRVPDADPEIAINIQRIWMDPNGRRPNGDLDPNHSDPNDTAKLTPPEDFGGNPYRIRSMDTKKYWHWDFTAMERNGFWLLLQFEIDPNYPPGTQHGKWLKAAFWPGDKYDWDGTWALSYELSQPYWSGRDPNRLYAPCTEGRTAIVAQTGRYDFWSNGFPADVVYDNIEGRLGIWNGVARKLTLNVAHSNWMQSMTIDPIADPRYDPNDPNNVNHLELRYTDGTPIVLTATPISGKSFKAWTIYDPNYPGDVSHATVDSNTVLYLTMNADYTIDADFKCGSGLPPFVAMAAFALGAALMIRRMS
jgi:hypothetical protein